MDMFFMTALAVLGFVLTSLGILNRILAKLNQTVQLVGKLMVSISRLKMKKDNADAPPRQE